MLVVSATIAVRWLEVIVGTNEQELAIPTPEQLGLGRILDLLKNT